MEFPIRYSISDELKRLISGENETVFQLLESRFCVEILTRKSGALFIREKDGGDSQGLLKSLDGLKLAARSGREISLDWVKHQLDFKPTPAEFSAKGPILRNRFGSPVFPKTKTQEFLVEQSEKNDILFVNGPAGTGKTFLAVALAVSALERREVERICLVRPAVEAGESLGFLPGDLKEKIAPYLRPINDCLSEFLPEEKLARYRETATIEIAPLAYMRGRTLKRAFILLDEAQNTTIPQMKMFLTRLGEKSKAIITGDSSQVDLNKGERSGFLHAMNLLEGIRGISKIDLDMPDVLRHRLVQNIIAAYETRSDS